MLRASTINDASALADRTLTSLGIARGDVRRLQSLPFRQVIQAATAAQPPSRPGVSSYVLSPVVDGRSLPRNPFDPDAPSVSAHVPIIIGSNKDEATLFTMLDPQFGTMTADDVRGRFASIYGDGAAAKFDAVQRHRPADPPTYWYTTAITAGGTWGNSIKLAERKAALGEAPVFMYRLDWETPVLDGRLRAPHGLDTGLVFDNPTKAGGIVGSGPSAARIAAEMSQAWVNFAHSGNPSIRETAWPGYNSRLRQTMIFNLQPRVAADPDRDLRMAFD